MSDATPSNRVFSGEYRHAIDPKHRITLPFRWKRPDKEDEGEEFYLQVARGDGFVRAMPADRFKALGEQMRQTSDIAPRELSVFLRAFYSSSHHVALDKQRRLLVPEEFCVKTGLTGEIVLAGVYDFFELWNAEKWAANATVESPISKRIADQFGLL